MNDPAFFSYDLLAIGMTPEHGIVWIYRENIFNIVFALNAFGEMIGYESAFSPSTGWAVSYVGYAN